MKAPKWTESPAAIEEAKNYLRQGDTISFYERISRCILKEQPADLAAYALELVNAALEGNSLPALLSFKPESEEAHTFLHEKNVSEFIDSWVLALMDERPPSSSERLQFHKKYLEGLIAAK